MKLSILTFVLALAEQGSAIPASAPDADAAPTVAAAVCNKYVLIVSRPTGQKQGSLAGFDGGFTTGMITQTLSKIPGGIVYSTQYDASGGSKANNIQGGRDVIRYINNGLQNCPSQKYALPGYSLGASVNTIAMNYFNNTNSTGYKAIAAVVLEGNPAHESGRTANVDQNDGASTRNCNGFQYSGNDAREHISAPWYDSNKLRDICFKDDTLCCCPYLPAFHGLALLHLHYGSNQTVQDLGANFLINALK